MITHTSDSHQIPSQNNTKSKLQMLKIAKNTNFEILQQTLHATHLLKLLHNMYKYEMDLTRGGVLFLTQAWVLLNSKVHI